MKFQVTTFKQQALALATVRAIVFIDEQACPYEEEFDGLDDQAMQILGSEHHEPIACARIRLFDKTAKFERLAIRKAWRGKGHGGALLEFMLKQARLLDLSTVVLHAQCHALPYYQKYGFEEEGCLFKEVGIDHQKMTLQL